MTHFSDAYHYDPCRYCRGILRRDQMVPIKRLPGQNPKSRGWACPRCAEMRGYRGQNKVNLT